jgi:cbb3-type cytochrome oxidase subunit 3
MLLILLEALAALLIFIFIIWWTMFSGRKKGERKDE